MAGTTLVPDRATRPHHASMRTPAVQTDAPPPPSVHTGTIAGTTAKIQTTVKIATSENSSDDGLARGAMGVIKTTVKATNKTLNGVRAIDKQLTITPVKSGMFDALAPKIKYLNEHPAVVKGAPYFKAASKAFTVGAIVYVNADAASSFVDASQLRGVSQYKKNREGVEKLVTGNTGILTGMGVGAGGGALGGSVAVRLEVLLAALEEVSPGVFLARKQEKCWRRNLLKHKPETGLSKTWALSKPLFRELGMRTKSMPRRGNFLCSSNGKALFRLRKALASGDRNQAQLQATIYNNYLMHAGSPTLNGGVALLTPDEVKQADHFARADYAAAEKTGFHGVPPDVPSSTGTLTIARSKTDVAQAGYNDARDRLSVVVAQHTADDKADAAEVAKWRQQQQQKTAPQADTNGAQSQQVAGMQNAIAARGAGFSAVFRP